jgi:hypothetical protein
MKPKTTLPALQPVPQQLPPTFVQEQPPVHHCAPEMLDFVHGVVKKRMFGKDEWVEVQRCRFCKELYINRVKL